MTKIGVHSVCSFDLASLEAILVRVARQFRFCKALCVLHVVLKMPLSRPVIMLD